MLNKIFLLKVNKVNSYFHKCLYLIKFILSFAFNLNIFYQFRMQTKIL